MSLLGGLLIASISLDNPAGHPRFTFGSHRVLGSVGLIPMMIGMFAVSEILRYAVETSGAGEHFTRQIGNVFRGMWGSRSVLGLDPARQRARHRDRCAARRGRRYRGVDVVRDVEKFSRSRGSSAPATSRG